MLYKHLQGQSEGVMTHFLMGVSWTRANFGSHPLFFQIPFIVFTNHPVGSGFPHFWMDSPCVTVPAFPAQVGGWEGWVQGSSQQRGDALRPLRDLDQGAFVDRRRDWPAERPAWSTFQITMLSMGKRTISTGPFSIVMLNYQRVPFWELMLTFMEWESPSACSFFVIALFELLEHPKDTPEIVQFSMFFLLQAHNFWTRHTEILAHERACTEQYYHLLV